MASRINRAIELLAQDQAIYYVGAHTGHVRAPIGVDGTEPGRPWGLRVQGRLECFERARPGDRGVTVNVEVLFFQFENADP